MIGLILSCKILRLSLNLVDVCGASAVCRVIMIITKYLENLLFSRPVSLILHEVVLDLIESFYKL